MTTYHDKKDVFYQRNCQIKDKIQGQFSIVTCMNWSSLAGLQILIRPSRMKKKPDPKIRIQPSNKSGSRYVFDHKKPLYG